MTWRWIEEGGTFWPLMAIVQEGVRGAVVGATKSVEVMMVGDGIVTGCGEGLARNRAAIRITRRMMPPMMSQGRHRSPGHQLNCSMLRGIVVVAYMQDRECPMGKRSPDRVYWGSCPFFWLTKL
jgi:hypothetical protein